MFCDSLVSLFAFRDCRKSWYAGLNGIPTDQVFRRVREFYRTISPNYFIDFSDTAISNKWRLAYLLWIVHWCKLRSAVLEVTGA